jgi:hypothetical protein
VQTGKPEKGIKPVKREMKKEILITFVILAALTVALPSGWAQKILPLGTVSNVTALSSCAAGYNTGTKCYSATVSCPDLVDLGFTFGIKTPTSGASHGTVVLFSGGGGTVVAGGANVTEYEANGLTSVTVVWNTDWELTGETPNIKTAACRPATVLNYFHDNSQGGAMCAEGDSAGSAAIAYSLAEYGAGSYMDNVELMAGPVLSDIATGCNPFLSSGTVCGNGSCNTGDPPQGGWPDAPQYVDGNQQRLDYWTGVSGANVCTSQTASAAQYTKWKQMSIVDGLDDSSFFYPQTGIAGWLCSNTAINCTGAMCQNNSSAEGQIFYQQVYSERAPFAVYRINQCNGDEGVGDGVLPPPNEHITGNQAIAQDMIKNCVLRH